MRRNDTSWTKATVGIGHLVILAFVMTLVMSGPVKADTDLIVLSCRITDEWLREFTDLSPRTPPPTLQEVTNLFTQEGAYEVEVSFRTDGELTGIGTFGHDRVVTVVGERTVVFTTGYDDVKNASLDRYSGKLYYPAFENFIMNYQCTRKVQQF